MSVWFAFPKKVNRKRNAGAGRKDLPNLPLEEMRDRVFSWPLSCKAAWEGKLSTRKLGHHCAVKTTKSNDLDQNFPYPK